MCVEGDLVPYPEPFQTDYETDYKGPKPTVALLSLNKQIRYEALPVLFGKNSWRITFVPARLNIPDIRWDQLPLDPRRSFWGMFRPLIHHAVCRYSYRNVNAKLCTQDRRDVYNSTDIMDEGERAQRIHWFDCDNMKAGWMTMNLAIFKMTNLKTLEIYIDDLFCPAGCRREGPITTFFAYYALPMTTKVDIYGVRRNRYGPREAKTLRESILKWLLPMKTEAMANYTIHVAPATDGTEVHSTDEEEETGD